MSPDFRDLLAEFNAHGVEFLVVGAHALAAHGLVRATKDLDVWVRPAHANAERVIAALAAFGAPLHDLTVDDLARPGLIFQIGVEPIRIDVITRIDGVDGVFQIAGRGCVVTPGILKNADLVLSIGAALVLRRPDGSELHTVLRGIEMGSAPGFPALPLLLGEDVTKDQVPVGTEVWAS